MSIELTSIDAWLRGGGIVVTASERAARSLALAFHRTRRAEGLTAWSTPNIQDWQSFARRAWDERVGDIDPGGRVVLSRLQEQSLWARIVAHAAPEAVQLAGASDRLAALAIEAHHLLCDYAPQLLKDNARIGWDRDAGAFSGWLTAFNELCRDGKLVSAARLPLEVNAELEADSVEHPPLLLAGFDRILPTQQKLFAAWDVDGAVHEAPLGAAPEQVEFHLAADPAAELAACALWSKARLASDPHARLLVITQDARKRRGEIERGFLRFLGANENSPDAANLIEFSLGVPLGQIALARGAQLLLRWLSDAIAENELDWLLATDQIAASHEESLALTAFMRALRRRGLQRQRWTIAGFLRQRPRTELPVEWSVRMTQARQRLQELANRLQTPLAWAEFSGQLLQMAGWPGARALTSAEFQALRRWQQTVDDCASLGFDGRRIAWNDFLAALDRAVDETLFAPESQDAPILIAGPAESAGLTADAIWFLGASEEAWPAAGATHALIPIGVQREAGMPHASPKLDWDLANAMTRRVLASAPEIHFSYARQNEGVEARPSRLVVQVAGLAQPLPANLTAATIQDPLTVAFDDTTQLPYPPRAVSGGSNVLTTQSRCAFQAFATARLDAEKWDASEAGLTALERGLLLHEVLHSIWGGPPNGIRTHAELAALSNLAAFVEGHARCVLKEKIPPRARECMPPRYFELEGQRLVVLITEWLRFEQSRLPFTVLETEKKTDVSIAGLPLHLRLDRVDRLNDGSLLVIDYKTGDAKAKSWELPRPDDLQLPLYAGFALRYEEGEVGGLVFAKLRAGDSCFEGRVKAAKQTLKAGLSANSNLVRKPLMQQDMTAWRDEINKLAKAFLAGRADVNPREYPQTCKNCGLQAICRIQEIHDGEGTGNDTDGEEVGGE
ncbi:MAG TPA: PD-(D/E)XK nuclease family protein [Terracidiphilus sp.]|nr:PD-(D/E)XK nuclease family protein [Terracidiphilus sp.]